MSRSWQSFVERTLCFRDYAHLYDGVCFVDKADRIVYTHGCFRDDSVVNGDDDDQENKTPFDSTQFHRAFEQHTRLAMRDATIANGGSINTSSLDAVASLCLGSERFQVVSTSFTSLCAVAAGKRSGLIAQRLPFGILVVACRYPNTVEAVAPVVERCCHGLR